MPVHVTGCSSVRWLYEEVICPVVPRIRPPDVPTGAARYPEQSTCHRSHGPDVWRDIKTTVQAPDFVERFGDQDRPKTLLRAIHCRGFTRVFTPPRHRCPDF